VNAEQWQKVDQLFQQAAELDVAARTGFLDQACRGDRALREEVDSLLASDEVRWDLIDDEVLSQAAPFLAVDSPQLGAGARLGHYQVIRLIGRGGMGEVYLARDETLKRQVALKLLPAEYTASGERLRRFEQEAHAASALNHPNILTVHELRLDEHFIATEFVEGETLRQRLNRGRIPLSEILDIAVQAATAMTAAHQAGIVHRDIKPENIMLRPDGYVKVLDFGLSKLRPEVETGLTGDADQDLAASSALLMGTVKYMSPEQAQGLAVDQRSDIFSLGAVLYEMVFAEPLFKGSNTADIFESLLHHEPAALVSPSSETPKSLLTILQQALAKNKASRYQSGKELIEDLKGLGRDLEHESRLYTAATVSAVIRQRIRKVSSRLFRTKARIALLSTLAIILIIGVAAAVSWSLRRQPVLTWVTRAPLPRPRSQAAVATLNQQIYVVSGFDDSGTTDSVLAYDPATNQWNQRAPLPTPRSTAGAAAIDGKLYVFGGCGKNSEGNLDCRIAVSNVLEVYDPATNTWTSKAPMPTARSQTASAVINGKLYVAGGTGNCGTCALFKMLEVYDPQTDTWDTTKAPLPTGQAAGGGVALDGKFYVLGGAQTQAQVYDKKQYLAVYDPLTDRWTNKSQLPTLQKVAGLAAVHDKLFVIGGLTAVGDSKAVESYDPRTDRWASEPPLPAAIEFPQPVVIDGTIYLAGRGGAGNNPNARLDSYVVPCPGSACSSAPSGLIAWWPGDGKANDLVGASPGRFQGNVTFAPGKVGQAFNFDGSSFVTMGDPPALHLTSTQVTMAGWIYPRANRPAVCFGKTKSGYSDYLLSFGRGIAATIMSGGAGLAVLGYSDFPANQTLYEPALSHWTHIAVTYDGSQIKLYANGELIGAGDIAGAISGHDVPFNIGGANDNEGLGKFDGLIDEVEVFDRTLSPQEIKEIFETGEAGHCKSRESCF